MNNRFQLLGENRFDDKVEGGWFVVILFSLFFVEVGGFLSNRNNSSQSILRIMLFNVVKSWRSFMYLLIK